LELSEEETVIQLINYIEKTSYLRPFSKGKEKETEDVIPLILPTRTAGLVLPILSAYTQQITLSEFQTSNNSSFLSS